ncbi:hypothetical protein M5K25_004499 [Dendrobium thyrsiflorum]|uniref:Uncharacterized protein n=1 Tax=Dendrobium thyrsiflorum TaxID=117978 RepID=A0ABD0VLU4_DENTH
MVSLLNFLKSFGILLVMLCARFFIFFNMDNARNLNKIMKYFSYVSGLFINSYKSSLVITKYHHLEVAISFIMGIRISLYPLKYLGFPLSSILILLIFNLFLVVLGFSWLVGKQNCFLLLV